MHIKMERRYDIDWLRVMAIGLLVIYHIAIGFQPWGVFIRFIQNDQPLEVLWIPMSMLNVWRIPLLFWVSGMGVAFAMRKRNWKTLLLERIRRILLPFIAGMLLVVPLHILLWQSYYRQALTYTVKPGHLWFLANIFAYALLLMPVYFLLKKHRNGPLSKFLVWVFGNPLGPAVIILFFALEARILNPDLFEMYAMTTHGFILGLMAFFFWICLHLLRGYFLGDPFEISVVAARTGFGSISHKINVLRPSHSCVPDVHRVQFVDIRCVWFRTQTSQQARSCAKLSSGNRISTLHLAYGLSLFGFLLYFPSRYGPCT